MTRSRYWGSWSRIDSHKNLGCHSLTDWRAPVNLISSNRRIGQLGFPKASWRIERPKFGFIMLCCLEFSDCIHLVDVARPRLVKQLRCPPFPQFWIGTALDSYTWVPFHNLPKHHFLSFQMKSLTTKTLKNHRTFTSNPAHFASATEDVLGLSAAI